MDRSFNGTIFGKFKCPLPGFNKTASWCCGSKDEQNQYCCKWFDEYVPYHKQTF
jgi:hypothetical protein